MNSKLRNVILNLAIRVLALTYFRSDILLRIPSHFSVFFNDVSRHFFQIKEFVFIFEKSCAHFIKQMLRPGNFITYSYTETTSCYTEYTRLEILRILHPL